LPSPNRSSPVQRQEKILVFSLALALASFIMHRLIVFIYSVLVCLSCISFVTESPTC
jgi:hypothetical protein